LPIDNYALVRQLAGVLFLLDALAFAPWAQVALGPGYFRGGEARSRALPWLLALWVAGSLSLVSGVYPLAGALILFAIFRHLYIHNRWKNLFRGGGAPGFMSHWLTAYVVLFEAAAVLDGSGALGSHVLKMLRIDFAVILMCSGAYKSLSGYLFGEGMEYGLANPLWGYWWRFFRQIRPSHLLFRLQDIGAATTQWVMGLFLLFERTRAIGALMCIGSFLYLLLTVRLGRLAALMMIIPLLCLPEFGIALVYGADLSPAPIATPAPVLAILHGLITAYLVLLPLVKAMQYLNLFARIHFPGPIQRALTAYANAIPIIMWRVFTPDVTNFFIRIYRIDDAAGAETPLLHEDTTYAYRDLARWRWSLRFLHVTESIAITTVFTTLKYFRSQRTLFESKLLEYAGTLGEPAARARFRFQYVALIKGKRGFDAVPVVNFRVDVARQQVEEERLVDYAYDQPARHSHIKETIGYGSYLPKTAGGRS
jgi:hypothetical protein